MTDEETERLVAEMEALPSYRGWGFTYEYPGYFCFSHTELPYNVFCTPDWEGEESMPIEVQDDEGQVHEEHCDRLPLPYEGRTGQKIFELVRLSLDKLLALTPKVDPELCVRLTSAEIAALQKTHEHVRVHMAHEHPWEVRDTAMGAISKILAAAAHAAQS